MLKNISALVENTGGCASHLRDEAAAGAVVSEPVEGYLCSLSEAVSITHIQTALVTQTLQYGHVFLPWRIHELL